MPNVPSPAKTKKEKRKEQRQRIRKLENLLQKQKELTHLQTKRALRWKAKCKRAKKAKASLKEERDNLKLKEKERYLPYVAPIVAAVVFQALYWKERFWEFGCEKAEEVDSFADLWVGIMQGRNRAAHQIMAEDVIAVLSHCEATLREVMERAFKFLWGISAWGP
ncbi:hypothetical protein C7212DRAFT_340578 [Tuber magnatum]|uniref:Uncharacterized protein n=1 Tax=Tuber magnatum TaxID=42249 RepID=A0A317T368_9PEZI|nr:hypothetical protein C7212DRAFT_340578 [Tuber magnatum]